MRIAQLLPGLFSRRVLFYFNGFCLSTWVLFFLLYSFHPIRCFDIWWHLATGRYIIEHLHIPHTDPFSYTHYGVRWIDSMWLFQVVNYLAYLVAGFCGVVILKVLILGAAFLTLRTVVKNISNDDLLVQAILWLVLLATSFRFTTRPHIGGYLLYVLCWYGLLRLDRQMSWSNIAFVFFCILLWANIHGSFILGVFLTGIYALCRLAIYLRKELKDAWKIDDFRKTVYLCCLVAVAMFLNPYGIKLPYFVLFSHSGESKEALRYIQEWFTISPHFFFVFGWDRSLFFKFLFWTSWITAFLAAYKAIRSGNTRDTLWLIYLGGLSYLVLQHYRFAGFFAFGAAPVIAMMYRRHGNTGTFLRPIMCVMLFLALAFSARSVIGHNISAPACGVKWKLYPKYTVDFIKKNHLPSPLFNTYGWGGYLIWELYPDYRVFIDGRTPTVYSPDFYWLFRKAEDANKEVVENLLKEYNFKTVITKSMKMCRLLKKEFGFEVVGFDDKGILLVSGKDLPGNVKTFRAYDPCRSFYEQLKELKENSKDEKFEKEAEKIEKELSYAANVFHSSRALNNLGIIYSDYLKKHRKALEFYKKALALSPKDFSVLYNLGLCHYELKEYHKALKHLVDARNRNPKNAKTWLMIAKTLYELGDYKGAFKAIKKHLWLVGDGASSEAYQYLGLIKNQLYDVEGAVRAFKRALFIAKSEEEKEICHYNLGKCYAALENIAEARKHFLEALNLNANSTRIREALMEIDSLDQTNFTKGRNTKAESLKVE